MVHNVVVVRNNRPVGIADAAYHPDLEEMVKAKLLSAHTDGVHPVMTPYIKRTDRFGTRLVSSSANALIQGSSPDVLPHSRDRLIGMGIEGFHGRASANPEFLKEFERMRRHITKDNG